MVMPAYYDYLLATIPSILFGVPAVLTLVGVPFMTGITAGATICVGLVAHGLFIRSPTDTVPANVQIDSTIPEPDDVTQPDPQPTANTGLDTNQPNTRSPQNRA